MSAFAHDLKVALRALAARPASSFVVTGMLALGITGMATIFTVYSGLFLRPMRR